MLAAAGVLAVQRAVVLLGCSLLRFSGQMEQTSRFQMFVLFLKS